MIPIFTLRNHFASTKVHRQSTLQCYICTPHDFGQHITVLWHGYTLKQSFKILMLRFLKF